jgi:hypothetical protein
MKIATRALGALFLACFQAAAQTDDSPATLHLTINQPPSSVVTSMFGTLPKDVSLVEVTACNNTPNTLLLSNGHVVQALHKSGIQALSRGAAIATMQASEGRTWKRILLRNSIHGMNIVNFLVISKALSLGPALSNALPSVQALLEAVVPEFAKDVPEHQYLNFDQSTLPDKTQLNPLDCVAGLMFAAKSKAPAPAELTLDIPSVNVTTTVTVPPSGSRKN